MGQAHEAFPRPNTPPLKLLAEDTGRTWIVEYSDLRWIAASPMLKHGDVLIVSHREKTGLMFMQALKSDSTVPTWSFEDVGPPPHPRN